MRGTLWFTASDLTGQKVMEAAFTFETADVFTLGSWPEHTGLSPDMQARCLVEEWLDNFLGVLKLHLTAKQWVGNGMELVYGGHAAGESIYVANDRVVTDGKDRVVMAIMPPPPTPKPPTLHIGFDWPERETIDE